MLYRVRKAAADHRIQSVLGGHRGDHLRRRKKREIKTMTDIKFGETGGPPVERVVTEPASNRWSDWAARAAIVIVFTGFALVGLAGIPRLVPLDSIHKLLMVP